MPLGSGWLGCRNCLKKKGSDEGARARAEMKKGDLPDTLALYSASSPDGLRARAACP